MNTFPWSDYQLNIFDWILQDRGINLVVEAVAGSGKSKTIEGAMQQIDSSLEVIYLAFGKDIALSFQDKIPSYSKAVTYHSAGRSFCVDTFGRRMIVDKNKSYGIMKSLLPDYDDGYLFSPVMKLASLCKANLLEPTSENIIDLSLYHGIDINGDSYRIIDLVQKLIKKSIQMTNVIDFDDMVYLPVVLGLRGHRYDIVFIDELQDTNRTQIELALMMVKSGGKIIGVGDRNQSIYGFRGADVNAIPSLISRLNADTLPLSVTYRNPLKVVEYVNKRFPDIRFESAPNAILGVLDEISSSQFINNITGNEMVLCRTNAPLVAYCFELIRNGIKANIKGRDIGDNLVTLIKKFKTDSLIDLIGKLEDYREIETDKLYMSKKESQAILLADKVNTIIAISDGCKYVSEVISKIDLIFSDKTPGVCLSSIHKAKGLEADKVSIICPELMPHPMAKQEWEREQEKNIQYVASTRALKELHFVEN